jgi:hypothetical protein
VEVAQSSKAASGEEKLRMLRFGTDSEEDARQWEAESGIAARILLIKDSSERAARFKEWKDQQRSN